MCTSHFMKLNYRTDNILYYGDWQEYTTPPLIANDLLSYVEPTQLVGVPMRLWVRCLAIYLNDRDATAQTLRKSDI